MSALQSHFCVLCPLEGVTASTNFQPDSLHNEFSLDCLMWDAETCKPDPLPAPPPLVLYVSMAILNITATCICGCFLPVVAPCTILLPKSSAKNFLVCSQTPSLWGSFIDLTCTKASRSSATEER